MLGPGKASARKAQVKYRVWLTEDTEADLVRLHEFILDRNATDWDLAERTLGALRESVGALGHSPFSDRKAVPNNSSLRELLIPFGATGYVALCEIENDKTVTISAVRHQRESDYH